MYIVIEAHGGAEYAIICTNEDGKNKIFRSWLEAKTFANEECQNAIVVEV